MFWVEGGRIFIGRHHDVGEFDLVSGSAPKETVHTFSGFKCESCDEHEMRNPVAVGSRLRNHCSAV